MSIVDKVKEMLGQHGDKAKHGMDKAGDMFDQKTGGKHSDKVDKAQEKGRDFIDKNNRGGQGGDGGPGPTGSGGGQPAS
ncbi:antitoxin [Spirillospora sp. NBC_01491]|uniref:antitoxin n=1 Tax=Spirillospora sp. NBC_01491 TaxID=2976007 RepID=UPI002E325E78|nr:antitoxin [Spirillospora sp. NBC_01491]